MPTMAIGHPSPAQVDRHRQGGGDDRRDGLPEGDRPEHFQEGGNYVLQPKGNQGGPPKKNLDA
jgi:hypothetical protein